MPFIKIYAASDFVVTPPDEFRGDASGTPTFTLTLRAGATPVTVEVDDTDNSVDEITTVGPQTFTNDTTIGGTTYLAGTSYHAAYDLTNTGTGHKVTSLHFGGDGREQGPVDGIISTIPLVPGVAYTFDAERSSYRQIDNTYSTYEETVCFAAGTMIDTPNGAKAIEELRVGDLVRTRDNGLQPIRWIGSRHLDAANLAAVPKLRPIRIMADALAPGLPKTDLLVSPQHRMLIRSRIAQRCFGTSEILAAAKHLTPVAGICVADDVEEVVYFHMLFDHHEIVFANGAESESFFTGPQALKSVGQAARDEIYALFPELRDGADRPKAVRPIVHGRDARELASRHQKNIRALVS
ncbi:Hint domain-containing protein [Primorskyibacter sedentarius]|uniref:Hint domain-containing protein n=1 Tax=Primorskyibacter sedentarius TaxID=745311 RepID=A0A4R3J8V5_9RHOB|nr:Hint domain-containing protein [Primorskyibacter sedentarius]TCS61944.1 Hint domain-containing protein [Primorskyibacter sedentarius]